MSLLSVTELIDEEEENKESDVELEPDGDIENEIKVREKSCGRRPTAGRGRSDDDAKNCLGDGKRANSKSQEAKQSNDCRCF